MKKILMKLPLLAMMALGIITASAKEPSTVIDGVTYLLQDGHATVDLIADQASVVILPSVSIDGTEYPVTEISTHSATSSTDDRVIESLTIPPSVKFIGCYAFQYTKVTNLYIDDLAAWCDIEFEYEIYAAGHSSHYYSYANPIGYDTSLFVRGEKMVDLVIPDEVKEIKNYAFRYLNFRTLNTGDGVETIGMEAFYGSSVEEVFLGKSLATIGSKAFYECKELSSMDLSDSLEYVSGDACQSSSLKIVRVSSLEKWLSIRKGTTHPSNMTIDYVYSVPFGVGYDLYVGGEILEDVLIPGDVELSPFAFAGANIRTFEGEEGMVDTGLRPVYSCPKLEKVVLPSTIELFGITKQLDVLEIRALVPPKINYTAPYINYETRWYFLWFNTELLVPEEALDAYKADRFWGEFERITPIKTTSAITTEANNFEEEVILDLHGRRMSRDVTPIPGIYIIGGKKVMVGNQWP